MKASLLGWLLVLSVGAAAQQAGDDEAPAAPAEPTAATAQDEGPAAPPDAKAAEPDDAGEDLSGERDFQPEEEISEDFPVPLPADI